ncbi:lytic polysaccharide monooxygenase [Oceanobacillus iheyensis]|uniref:lytic polysaccharide monooxygenase n=1 Tax=Oceanobacillus iheyensis TaxID=182710 RepID=UPI003628FACC
MKAVFRTKSMKLFGTSIAALAFFTFAAWQTASAHGYIEEPQSRNLLCHEQVNTDCGAIQWEPQSLEAPKGFPGPSIPDGQIASAGGAFPELDEQSANRWEKVDMDWGTNTFTWHLTAMHATTKWHYYITKPDWNPNEPLTRDQFELVPFYEIYDGGARPGQKVTHQVTIPERSGYHIILGVWDVNDTANAFYNVIDANFGGESTDPDPEPGDPEEPELPDVPEWNASTVYLGGDQVTYNGKLYQAKWWTRGDVPGNSQEWEEVVTGATTSQDAFESITAWNTLAY